VIGNINHESNRLRSFKTVERSQTEWVISCQDAVIRPCPAAYPDNGGGRAFTHAHSHTYHHSGSLDAPVRPFGRGLCHNYKIFIAVGATNKFRNKFISHTHQNPYHFFFYRTYSVVEKSRNCLI
jgi:hypothetical protein